MSKPDREIEQAGSFVEEVDIETYLLPEETAKESDFPNHNRIIDALERTIASDEPGQSIALLGKVGSGKSTIIRLLEERITSDCTANDVEGGKRDAQASEIKFIHYDAWKHKGQSTRRSFIQKLAKELKGTEWETEDLDERVQDVTRRKGESATRLTIVGIIAAITGLITPPLVLTFSNIGIFDLSAWMPFIGDFSLTTSTIRGGVLICLGLLLLILFGALIYQHNADPDDRTAGELFQSASSTRVGGEISERQTPSTFDFLGSFEAILKGALEEDSNRRLIIIIENMDRLPPTEAGNVWSMLQTFFDAHTSDGNQLTTDENAWRDRFWTVVPFSWRALSTSERQNDLIRPDFLDKTFQLTLRVKPPVSSDFEDFFAQRFADAFPNLEGSKTMRQVRELFFLRSHEDTPRAVKRFLNNLVGSVRKWGDAKISIPVQAAYHLIVDLPGSDMINDLRGGSRVLKAESLICEIPIPNLRRQLLGLCFGVKPNLALQSLMGDEINEALREGDSNRLRELQEERFEGFEILVRDKVRSIAKGSASNLIPQAGNALSNLEQTQQRYIVEARNRLVRIIKDIETWDSYVEGVGEGLATILSDIAAEEFKDVAPSLLQSFSHFKEGASYDDWVETTVPILKAIRNRNNSTGLQVIEENFRVPKSALDYLNALAKFYDMPIRG